LDLLRGYEGNDQVIIYLGKEKAKKVLPRNWNVEAKEELLDALRGKLGEKNVKVLEKTIDKVGRRG